MHWEEYRGHECAEGTSYTVEELQSQRRGRARGLAA